VRLHPFVDAQQHPCGTPLLLRFSPIPHWTDRNLHLGLGPRKVDSTSACCRAWSQRHGHSFHLAIVGSLPGFLQPFQLQPRLDGLELELERFFVLLFFVGGRIWLAERHWPAFAGGGRYGCALVPRFVALAGRGGHQLGFVGRLRRPVRGLFRGCDGISSDRE
jgi:hypothetical protein